VALAEFLMRPLLQALSRLWRGPGGGGELLFQPLPGIGDTVWHLPALHAIAAQAPRGRLDLLTKPRSRADRLLAGDPSVREVLWLERNPGRHDGLAGLWRLVRELRARRYDRAWLLHDSTRYALALWLAGIPVTRGYGQRASRLLLSEPMALPGGTRNRHPIELAGVLLEAYGVPQTEEEPRLPVSPEAEERIGRRFGAIPQPWLALGLGSSEPRKQWGGERFAALAAELAGQGEWQLILLGAAAERPLAQAVLAAAPGHAHDALDLPIDDTAALLARCRGYVGNDTGFLNMAAALGVPAIGLFGGSPPLTHSRRIRVLRPAHGEGMAGITVGQVMEAVGALREGSGGD